MNNFIKALNKSDYREVEWPVNSAELVRVISGETLIRLSEEAGIKFKVKANVRLTGNHAALRLWDLHLSPEAKDCLLDPDTALETMKGLSIILI